MRTPASASPRVRSNADHGRAGERPYGALRRGRRAAARGMARPAGRLAHGRRPIVRRRFGRRCPDHVRQARLAELRNRGDRHVRQGAGRFAVGGDRFSRGPVGRDALLAVSDPLQVRPLGRSRVRRAARLAAMERPRSGQGGRGLPARPPAKAPRRGPRRERRGLRRRPVGGRQRLLSRSRRRPGRPGRQRLRRPIRRRLGAAASAVAGRGREGTPAVRGGRPSRFFGRRPGEHAGLGRQGDRVRRDRQRVRRLRRQGRHAGADARRDASTGRPTAAAR